jgi:hypothetical protein
MQDHDATVEYGGIFDVLLPPRMAGPKVGRNSREPALYGGGVGCDETVVEKNIGKNNSQDTRSFANDKCQSFHLEYIHFYDFH